MADEIADARLPILVVICAPASGLAGDGRLAHLPVDGWREWRQMRAAVEQAARDPRSRGALLRLMRLHPPTLPALREALQAGRGASPYAMAHIIGAAPSDGLFLLERSNGREHPVSPAELAEVFRGASVEIVLFNVCFGVEFAKSLVAAGVRAALAVDGEISEPEAVLLAREIYLNLALETTIGEALHFAREAIIEAYQQRQLPPLSGWSATNEASLREYGRARAAQIVVIGDEQARLPMPPVDAANGKPVFDLSEPPHNLVWPEDVFIGRGRELAQLGDWMEERRRRIIALTGIGGIGKSSLALAAASRNSWRFDGVIYLTAKDAGGPRSLSLDDLCREIDTVFGLEGALRNLATTEARRQRLMEALNARNCLLILDNLEDLSNEQTAEWADFLQRLDPHTGTMALLTLRPEHQPPLVNRTKGHCYHLAVESLSQTDAVALLAASLHSSNDWDKVPSGFAMPERVSPNVAAQGIERLESLAELAGAPARKVAALESLAAAAHCHPLLLEIAAADLRKEESGWDSVLERLKGLRGGDLQEKVADMIGRMVDDLARREPDALALLQSLLVFSGGATRDALRFVWWCRRLEPGTTEAASFDEICQAARRAALLNLSAERYETHPLARQYLTEWRPSGQRQRNQWRLAHAVFFLDYARRHRDDHESLERERLNLLAAIKAAEEASLDGMAVKFALRLFDFLWARGFWSEGREHINRAIGAAQGLKDHEGEAALFHALGLLTGDQGDYEEARGYLEQSLALKRMLSDTAGQAVTLRALGQIARRQGEQVEARRCFEESLRLGKTPDNQQGEAWTLQQLGILCKEQGEDAEAERYFEKGLALFEALSNQAGRAAILREFGDLRRNQNNYGEARRLYEMSLELAVGVRDSLITIYKLARISYLEGMIGEAEESHYLSLTLATQIISPFWQAHNLRRLGLCALARKQPEEARQRLQRAKEIAARLGLPLVKEIDAELKNLTA